MVLGRLGAGMEDDFIRMELWGMMERSFFWEGWWMIGEYLLECLRKLGIRDNCYWIGFEILKI